MNGNQSLAIETLDTIRHIRYPRLPNLVITAEERNPELNAAAQTIQ
jgi:hypothetical protein